MDVNLSDLWEPYTRNGRTYIRRRHNAVRSPRLQAFDRCVEERLRGKTYRGQGAVADKRAVQDALSRASRSCSLEVTGHGRV